MEMDKKSEVETKKVINNTTEINVDNFELSLILDFISFIRSRERGEYKIEIHTHNGSRSVLIDSTDKKRLELNPKINPIVNIQK